MSWVIKLETGAGKTLCAWTFFSRLRVVAPYVRKFCKEQGDAVFEIAKLAFERRLNVHVVSEFLGLNERTDRHYAQTWSEKHPLIDFVSLALRKP